jgi:8-oxo-dGTP pyrophosphatase MutT (NUDIX family)
MMALTHAGGIVIKHVCGETLFLVITSSRDKSQWVLPKGHIEVNETPESAAIREVMEETGFLAKLIKEAGRSSFEKNNKQVNVVYFLMEIVKNNEGTSEDRQINWLRKSDAIERLSFDDAKNILRKI